MNVERPCRPAPGFPAAILLLAACGSSGTPPSLPGDAGKKADARVAAETGKPTAHDGGARDGGSPESAKGVDRAASCVPTVPKLAWTSPYAGWSRGVPLDPSFFPIGVWLQQASHAVELAALGINVYVANSAGVDPLAAQDLATLKQHGIYAIIGQDSVGLANIDDPTVIGWWMTPDEPDNAQSNGSGGYGPPVSPAALVTAYDATKARDPTRPVWLGLGQGVAYDGWEGRGSNAPPESGYVAASDIVAFDIYPYNNCGGDSNEQAVCGEFWLNALGVDRLHQWSSRHQAVWSDFETTVIGAGTTAGPTPAQTASEVWLAIIHSANGVLYFIDSWNPSFREDAIFESPAMVSAVTSLNQQIKSLAPTLNSPTLPGLVTVTTSGDGGAPIDTMVKASGSSIVIFSAISRAGTATASFSIPGLTGHGVATVLGESRTIEVAGGQFSDTFAANAVHIYTVDLAAVSCH